MYYILNIFDEFYIKNGFKMKGTDGHDFAIKILQQHGLNINCFMQLATVTFEKCAT